MFSNFHIDPRQLYSLFIINVGAISVFSVAFSCFNRLLLTDLPFSYYIFIEHVYSPKLNVFIVSSLYAL